MLSGWPCLSPQGSLAPAPELRGDLVRLLTPLPKLEPGLGTAQAAALEHRDGCPFQAIYSCVETNEHV